MSNGAGITSTAMFGQSALELAQPSMLPSMANITFMPVGGVCRAEPCWAWKQDSVGGTRVARRGISWLERAFQGMRLRQHACRIKSQWAYMSLRPAARLSTWRERERERFATACKGVPGLARACAGMQPRLFTSALK
eukprot:9087650-Alexandrium_andersonii.AAC.1